MNPLPSTNRDWWPSKLNRKRFQLLALFSFSVTVLPVIQSFGDDVTEKIFLGDTLSRKELQKLGDLDITKAQQRLAVLHQASEQDLLRLPMLHYHRLHGTARYSIDATSRRSRWRITFAWTDEQATVVELVLLEDTH